jgi:3-dehydroquinate synthase
MPTETATSEGAHQVSDAIALPIRDVVITARARREDTYPIHVTRTLPQLVRFVRSVTGDARLAIITDETVDELHGRALSDVFDTAGIRHCSFALPPGEPSKSLEQAKRLWDWLTDSGIERRDVIVAFGGSVISDTAGWVASAYMRGIRYINLPTTLLAQVDGAMGGKVAVNHPAAKNLLGAFWQPAGVVSNVAYLSTLDERHVRAGLAESIKKAIIASPEYWRFIDDHAEEILALDLDVLEQLVRSAAAIKTKLVERDPYENDLRRALNFGHTIAHPLETVSGYGEVLHGEAVAFGMLVETRIAANRGLLEEPVLDRLIDLLERVGLLQLRVQVDVDEMIAAMSPVRWIRGGSWRCPLPRRFGVTEIVDDVDDSEVREATIQTLAEGTRRGRGGDRLQEAAVSPGA